MIFGTPRRIARTRARRLRRKVRRLQSWPRRWFYRAASRYTPVVAAPSSAGLVLVPTSDTGFALGLFVRGRRKEYRRLEQALDALEQAGAAAVMSTFVDAGAHVGTTTLAALQRGFAAVVAIEPAPDTCRLLRANVALNGVHDRVTVIESALAATEGSATLDLLEGRSAKNRLATSGRAGGQTIEVEQTTLDELFDGGRLDPAQVGMLWIDTEGSEPLVLLGARQLLERGVPIVAELNPKLGDPQIAARMLAATEEHYTHVRDLGPRSTGAFEDVARLVAIGDRYRADNSFTDVVLARLR